MLTAILIFIGAGWFAAVAITIYHIARAPIGPDERGQDNPNG